jgi:hypothetical protein
MRHELPEIYGTAAMRVDLSDVSLFNALAQAEYRTYLKAGPAIFNNYLIQKAVPGPRGGSFR